MYVLPVLVAFAWSKRPIRYAVALGGILLVSTVQGGLTGNTIHKERDFFGVLKVRRDPGDRYLLLVSGSALHGAQALDPKTRRMPLTYYFPTGPVGDALGPMTDSRAALPTPRRVGVIGLGVGSLAAYARPGETWTFFELNPRVVEIAKNYFTYLSDVPSATSVAIEVGDARLRLREDGPARFDMLVLDAFSSDAIPVHLMTREAVAIYRRALAPGGVLLAHISNQHVLLEPILAALAFDAKMLAIGRDELDIDPAERRAQKASSHWVCLSESPDVLDAIAAKNKEWRRLPPPSNPKVWTDDFANVLAAMRF
jgi:SAM-dependent methyltransferase